MSNEDRRQHGLDVIAAYERLPGVETRDGAPLVQVVTDLLTDLRHAVQPDDFAKALLSEMHHTAELVCIGSLRQ